MQALEIAPCVYQIPGVPHQCGLIVSVEASEDDLVLFDANSVFLLQGLV